MRIMLDTNVLISMILFPGNRFTRMLEYITQQHTLVLSSFVVDELLGEKKATVKVLKSMDKWYGVTYKEDKPVVVAAIQKLKD